ncbi:MDR family MFS transporter [Tenuibacillus multivorans]|uniref:MFS transporter, DHA2 family, multidrug resistance protein n=1 Tax=Tenuibacillus multivorans TaxID=237069 RepID=A0A1H0DY73_9BACI|nr:MDR family MFS transporter [Tenuibacillus multivorans]GEL76731.1 multidrug transporter [Tenuibacillus multivorans]SDN75065.1 MFS transporter, DHA2 family, multidrug resistance protein [Tenuibacillus multivorans]
MSEVNTDQIKKAPMLAVMLVGAFFALLNETLLATALPSIMDDFNITENKVQWLTTAFLLTNGVMIPISAFLIERFSTRKIFLTAISVFILGTFVASISHSFPLLLTARVIQAAGCGIMLPLMMTVTLTIFPRDKRGKAMGFAGLVISFAPAIGPTLSGWLLEYNSWRSLFYVVLPIAIMTLIVAIFVIKNVTKLSYPKIDIISIILSSFGFGGLLFGFSSAGDAGWTNERVLISIIGGIVILALFIWRQLKLKTPMLEFRVFKFNIYTISLVITMIVMMSMIGAETMLPLYMQNTRGFTALESGLMLLPGAIVMGIMSPVTGMLFDKLGARKLAIPGLAIVGITTLMFTNLSMETSFTFLVIVYAIRMFGLSLAMMPVMTNGLNQLPQEWNAHGTAMANTLQQVSASIGTAILITVMTTGAERYNPDMSALQGSQAEIKEQIANNALINGYNIAFIVATVLSFVAMFLSFFLQKKISSQSKPLA